MRTLVMFPIGVTTTARSVTPLGGLRGCILMVHRTNERSPPYARAGLRGTKTYPAKRTSSNVPFSAYTASGYIDYTIHIVCLTGLARRKSFAFGGRLVADGVPEQPDPFMECGG